MNIKRIGLIGGSGVAVGGSSGTGSSTTIVDNLESMSKSAALSANMGRELNETKAPKIGYAPDLKVNFANELVGRGEATPHYIGNLRPTGDISIGDGNATITRIKGNSVVWNQLLSTTYTTSFYKNSTYRAYFAVQRDDVNTTHKYLAKMMVEVHDSNGNAVSLKYTMFTSTGPGTFRQNIGLGETNKFNSVIFTPSNIEYKFIGYYISGAPVDGDIVAFTVYCHDLTKMFGAGNEPTTIEEFEARKPLGVTDEYNEGEIISYEGDDNSLKSVGFNAWDEEWEVGGFFNGQKQETESYNQTIRSKNYIPVIPGETYALSAPQRMYVNYFDTNKNFISASPIIAGTGFTIPDNARYLWFRTFNNTYGTTYKHDISLHLVHSGYRNGEYQPYEENTLALPNVKDILDADGNQLFPYGLLSAGNVYDEITETKAIKRVGVVDTGTLTWRCCSELPYPIIQTDSLKGLIKENEFPNILCKRYITYPNTVTNFGSVKDANIRIYKVYNPTGIYNYLIGVYDDSYTNANTFKQAMQGVLLYYELAEPIEVDFEEPLNMTYDAWDFGTEELNSNSATTPLNADIIYQFNAVDRIRENSSAIDVLEEHVEERKTDGIELLTNGNLKLTLKGETREFMPATPTGDPLHYAYETAGAVYNATTDFIVRNAPWKDKVDTIEDKAKWGFDVVDANQVQQMTMGGTIYNYVQTTRTSPEGTTEPRYFLVGQASDGTWVKDETKVLHLPGHWYLNGLGDITDKEMKKVWEAPHGGTSGAYAYIKARTIIFRGGSGSYSQDFAGWCGDAKVETIPLGFIYPKAVEGMFYNCKNLVYIYGNGLLGSIAISLGVFSYNNILLPIRVLTHGGLQNKVIFSLLPYISKTSILSIINNAKPTIPVTITLHADRYAQLSEDVDIVAALQAKNTALEGTGGSVSLVSA